jgi:Rrf2 family protein
MPKLMKIPEAASLALHSMALLADSARGPTSARELALRLDASEAHLAKVMQRLEAGGLVKSTRGPKGGYVLSRPSDSITLKEVYELVEGPISPTKCLLETPICNGGACAFGRLLEQLDRRLRRYLETTPLSRLAIHKEAKHA